MFLIRCVFLIRRDGGRAAAYLQVFVFHGISTGSALRVNWRCRAITGVKPTCTKTYPYKYGNLPRTLFGPLVLVPALRPKGARTLAS